MSYGNAIWHCGTQEDNSKHSSIEVIAGLLILPKSHVKPVWVLREILRSPNSLRMGFTFLMDANTSKYFYNYSMGMKL